MKFKMIRLNEVCRKVKGTDKMTFLFILVHALHNGILVKPSYAT